MPKLEPSYKFQILLPHKLLTQISEVLRRVACFPHKLTAHEPTEYYQLPHSLCDSPTAGNSTHGNQGSDKIKPWNPWNLNNSENRKKVTWSSKHACALPDTKSEIWAKLQVEISHLMVMTPRENIPA